MCSEESSSLELSTLDDDDYLGVLLNEESSYVTDSQNISLTKIDDESRNHRRSSCISRKTVKYTYSDDEDDSVFRPEKPSRLKTKKKSLTTLKRKDEVPVEKILKNRTYNSQKRTRVSPPKTANDKLEDGDTTPKRRSVRLSRPPERLTIEWTTDDMNSSSSNSRRSLCSRNKIDDRLSTFGATRMPRTPRTHVKTVTPTLPSRPSMLLTPTTPKDRAMKALHVSSIPKSLPCREREFETIYNFLLKKIKGKDGGFMYVYGVPGAGKTATVDMVIERLRIEMNKKKINKFTLVNVNGMHLTQPKDVFRQIWKKLEDKFVSANEAKRLLEAKFSSVSDKPFLLLIDEFDALFNRSLNIVDTILDWVDQCKLIVVSIANSKDLVEEISKSSTKSRMFRERLCDVQFKTYTYQQLQEIIEDRLKDDEVFTKDAIQMLARKSAISGDVRVALNLCRRVLSEVGDAYSEKAINVFELQELLSKIFSDPRIEFIRTLSKQEQMLLLAVRDVFLNNGMAKCTLAEKVYEQYKTKCILNDVNVKDEWSLFRILRLFESYALLTLDEPTCTIHTKINLGNNVDLIQMAFPPRLNE